MNSSDKIDYAFGLLEGSALLDFERELALSPIEAESVERLDLAIHRFVDDGDLSKPPLDLAARTLAKVAESRKPRRTILDFVPVAVPFRWADVAVAAGIFMAGVLTLMPAVQKSKERMQQAGCGYNLQQLGRALWQYDQQAKHFPFGADKDPAAHTGTYAVLLNDNHLLGDVSYLDCPCNGPCKVKAPMRNFEDMSRLAKTDPAEHRKLLSRVEYAYNVGYVRPEGRVGPIENVSSSTLGLLADQPNHENYNTILAGNSPNHGGRGQSVLFSDLHVGWFNTRRISPFDADMYLNEDNRAAPGRNVRDAAMLPSFVPFKGW